MPNKPEPSWGEAVNKIAEDIYQIGKTDATLNANDWETLKPGVMKSLTDAVEKLVETAKPDWSKQEHADNQPQVAYALGGEKAIEAYQTNLIKLIRGDNRE